MLPVSLVSRSEMPVVKFEKKSPFLKKNSRKFVNNSAIQIEKKAQRIFGAILLIYFDRNPCSVSRPFPLPAHGVGRRASLRDRRGEGAPDLQLPAGGREAVLGQVVQGRQGVLQIRPQGPATDAGLQGGLGRRRRELDPHSGYYYSSSSSSSRGSQPAGREEFLSGSPEGNG